MWRAASPNTRLTLGDRLLGSRQQATALQRPLLESRFATGNPLGQQLAWMAVETSSHADAVTERYCLQQPVGALATSIFNAAAVLTHTAAGTLATRGCSGTEGDTSALCKATAFGGLLWRWTRRHSCSNCTPGLVVDPRVEWPKRVNRRLPVIVMCTAHRLHPLVVGGGCLEAESGNSRSCCAFRWRQLSKVRPLLVVASTAAPSHSGHPPLCERGPGRDIYKDALLP
jgi:hypothetical protein